MLNSNPRHPVTRIAFISASFQKICYNRTTYVDLINKEVISGKIAKDVFEIMAETGENPEKIVEEKGLKQVTDTGAIEKIIDDIITANPDNVAAYKNGKTNLAGWFVGQTMKMSQGKANPAIVNKLIKEKLDS